MVLAHFHTTLSNIIISLFSEYLIIQIEMRYLKCHQLTHGWIECLQFSQNPAPAKAANIIRDIDTSILT